MNSNIKDIQINKMDDENKIEVSVYNEEEEILNFRLYLTSKLEDYDYYCSLISKSLSTLKNYENIERIISTIRTIFRDYEESFLEVRLSKKNIEQYVEYISRQLYVYEYSESIKVKHNKINRFLIYDILESDSVLEKPKFFKDAVERLQNIKSIPLNANDMEFCEKFKTFYGRYPDFSSDGIYKEVDLMYKCGVLNSDKIKHPEEIIDKMLPFGYFDIANSNYDICSYRVIKEKELKRIKDLKKRSFN